MKVLRYELDDLESKRSNTFIFQNIETNVCSFDTQLNSILMAEVNKRARIENQLLRRVMSDSFFYNTTFI